MPQPTPPATARRRLTAILAAVSLLGSGALAATVTHTLADRAGRAESIGVLGCPDGVHRFTAGDPTDPVSCVHNDQPPAGVDVTQPVPTAALLAREGAAAAAVAAAEDAGVPAPATADAVSTNVTCDGDGTSGYRVQAVYTYDPTKPAGQPGGDRLAALTPSIRTWAAGVDTVFNRSAALTGGYRKVRWVTEPDGAGGCVVKILKMPLTTAQMTSDSVSTMAAGLQSAGHNLPNRKYVMWADANVICGQGNVYPYASNGGRYATANQDNYNNGSYAMYSRIDSGCWGQSASVEAHELVHNLGAVLDTAPHKTTNMHCTDDSDRMCYVDGYGVKMQQTCPADQEVLLDCNGDDYFSTYPAPGTWLAGNWNTANSAFLIGGGNGTTTGGTAGTNRTALTGNPGVAGLPTQVSAAVTKPAGRTHSTAFTVPNPYASDALCVVTGTGTDQASVRCQSRVNVTGIPVTATTTDSAGVVSTASTIVALDRTARTATLQVAAGSTTICGTGTAAVRATLTDTATGVGVFGATVSFVQGGKTIATAVTDTTGVASATVTLATAGPITATASSDPVYGDATTSSGAHTISTACPVTALSGSLSSSAVLHGQPVTVTGIARTAAGAAAAAKVTVSYAGQSTTVTSDSAGNWAASLTATATGAVTATADQASSSAGTVTVSAWPTKLTAGSAGADAGEPGTVTGTLSKYDPAVGTLMGVAGQVVTVTGGSWTRTTTTAADGRYTLTTPVLTAATTATVSTTGSAALAAASATTMIPVISYASALTAAAPAVVTPDATATVTGALTVRSSTGNTLAPAGAAIVVTVSTADGTSTHQTVTGTGGSYTVTLPALPADATVQASYAGSGPYPAATAPTVAIAVRTVVYRTELTLTALPARVAYWSDVPIAGTLTVRANTGSTVTLPAGTTVTVQYSAPGQQLRSLTVPVSTTGSWSTTLPNLTADTTVRVLFAAVGDWPDASVEAPGPVAVAGQQLSTMLTMKAPATTVYGSTPTVTGSLRAVAATGPVPPVSGARVRVVFGLSGKAPVTAFGTVSSTGAWSVRSPAVTAPVTAAAYFDATSSLPAAPSTVASVRAVNYSAAPAVSSTTRRTGAGTVSVTGTALKAYGATRAAVPFAKMRVSTYDAYGVARSHKYVTADRYGKFSSAPYAPYSGTVRVYQYPATGVNAGSAANRVLTVTLRPSVAVSTRYPRYGTYLTVTAATSPARSSKVLYVQRYAARRWTTVATVRTDRYGKARANVKQTAKGSVSYRVYGPSDKYNGAGYSSTVAVSVR